MIGVIDKRPGLGARPVEVNNMRIICDQCNQSITGTLKRVTGNFNLHPHCLIQFAGELKTSRLPKLTGTESSIPVWVQLKKTALAASLELVQSSIPVA